MRSKYLLCLNLTWMLFAPVVARILICARKKPLRSYPWQANPAATCLTGQDFRPRLSAPTIGRGARLATRSIEGVLRGAAFLRTVRAGCRRVPGGMTHREIRLMKKDLFALSPQRTGLYIGEFQSSSPVGLDEQVSRLVEGEVLAGLHRSCPTVGQGCECGAG